jgi:hypothetical protein
LPLDRKSYDVAVRLESLDTIHQLLHEEETATVFLLEILGQRRIGPCRGKVESRTFVGDVENDGVIAYGRANSYVLVFSLAVAAQYRVRDRFSEGDSNVQRAFTGWQMKLATLSRRELDYAFYVLDVAWDLDIERDVRLPHQKLSSARSRVSEIWKSVSSFVSSKSV